MKYLKSNLENVLLLYILYLLASYSEDKKMYTYHFYFDNLFTTLRVLAELKNRGYNDTGTLRPNRLDASCPIPSIATSDKKDRGFSGSVTCTVGSSTIMVTRWKYNTVVTVASTVHGQNPIGKAKRWLKKETKYVQIPVPHAIIDNYNKGMSGTDQMDQNVNADRIGIRGKKWWWSLFAWMLDVPMQNTWQIARARGTGIDQLTSRKEVAMSYLLRF